VTGKVVTARDEAHRKALELLREGRPLPVDLRGLALYHCGPVVEREDGGWRVVAAGPTTSARMESVEPEFMERTGVRLIIGKGGLGRGTAEAARRLGAAYAVFTGGAGVLAANSIKRVLGVHWLEELGMAEAMWELEVEDFGPLIVTIDSSGRNLYAEMEERRRKVLEQIYRELGFRSPPGARPPRHHAHGAGQVAQDLEPDRAEPGRRRPGEVAPPRAARLARVVDQDPARPQDPQDLGVHVLGVHAGAQGEAGRIVYHVGEGLTRHRADRLQRVPQEELGAPGREAPGPGVHRGDPQHVRVRLHGHHAGGPRAERVRGSVAEPGGDVQDHRPRAHARGPHLGGGVRPGGRAGDPVHVYPVDLERWRRALHVPQLVEGAREELDLRQASPGGRGQHVPLRGVERRPPQLLELHLQAAEGCAAAGQAHGLGAQAEVQADLDRVRA